MIRYSDDPDNANFNAIVNKSIFNRSYLYNDTTIIQFLPNGTLVGLDSIHGYEVIIDYMDAGLDHDLILLKFNDRQRLYHYKKKPNALEFYHLVENHQFDDVETHEIGDLYLRLKAFD